MRHCKRLMLLTQAAAWLLRPCMHHPPSSQPSSQYEKNSWTQSYKLSRYPCPVCFRQHVILKCLHAVIPIYTNGPRASRVPGITFSRYTMSNLSPGSTLYW